jgi:uncharacterized protein (TIGR03083 family)
MGPDDLLEATTANRLLLADVLDGLDEHQWAAPSLCRGWTVNAVAAHLLQPMLVGFGRFFVTSLRYRGDTDRTVDHLARALADRPREEITALLRAHAADRVSQPRVGPWGPFAETCLHLRDIVRPLDLVVDVPLAHWAALLGYLTSGRAAAALVPRGRLEGLRLTATDVARTWGRGAAVSGPAEALALAATGRAVVLPELEGPGVEVLESRLDRSAGR